MYFYNFRLIFETTSYNRCASSRRSQTLQKNELSFRFLLTVRHTKESNPWATVREQPYCYEQHLSCNSQINSKTELRNYGCNKGPLLWYQVFSVCCRMVSLSGKHSNRILPLLTLTLADSFQIPGNHQRRRQRNIPQERGQAENALCWKTDRWNPVWLKSWPRCSLWVQNRSGRRDQRVGRGMFWPLVDVPS